MVLRSFHPAVREWFEKTYGEPTPPQAEGWPAIAAGRNVLILAPTGSGKTLAAFLQCLNWLYQRAEAGEDIDGLSGVQVLYISPLKALNNDIYRNLELPLSGIKGAAAELGLTVPRLSAAVRTGDTPPDGRRAMMKKPPHILITTPESLFLMLSSAARRILRTVRFVIVDEIHALFPAKRGAHLSLCLEYLETLTVRPFQRIGLSATQRPLGEVAAFLGGAGRPVEIIDTGQRKSLDLRIELPVPDLRVLPEKTIWPEIYQRLLELVEQHRSTLVFVNNRHVAERVTANLNDLAGRDIARVHHGSVSREVRLEVEAMLKAGDLKCLVATSSLELGIDVGAIDLVVQVESPHEVARGLQRVGRAGHVVGLPSKGRIVPKTRADLLEAAVIAREMAGARIESMHAPKNCLDVLAQVIVGMAVEREWETSELFDVVRRAHGYAQLGREEFERVLAMLSGQIAGEEEFLEMRPRLYWDRLNGRVSASDTGKRLVYTSGGTIPDRGTYGVYLAGSPVRLGELDEEFVFERRVGDRFVLGTNCWRVEEIRQDRVIVRPADGAPTVPFWRGEGFGRRYELGLRVGAFLREMEQRLDEDDLAEHLQKECLLDADAARNLIAYLRGQREAVGVLPTDRRLVIEEFQDELGEWRVVLHSVFGQRVNAALAMLLVADLRQKRGIQVESVRMDDAIVFQCPAAAEPPDLDPAALVEEDLDGKIAELVGPLTLFGLLFRQNAARALLLPRGAFGKKRTPLWLSRLKAADLLQVVQKHEAFPIVTETYREILGDIFDVQGLNALLLGIRTGAVQVFRCRRMEPSPFAQPALFGLVASYLYEPDLPKAERRLHALSLDRGALDRVLGRTEARQVLDGREIARALSEIRHEEALGKEPTPDEVHAILLRLGEIDADDAVLADCENQLLRLAADGRAVLAAWSPSEKDAVATGISAWLPAENLEDYKVALGPRLGPLRCARGAEDDGEAGSDCVAARAVKSPAQAVEAVIRRYAGSRGLFTAAEVRARYGFPETEVLAILRRQEAEGRVVAGVFRSDGSSEEWCDAAFLQKVRRRSLARARREVEPREPEDFAAFLARWQGLGSPGSGVEGVRKALEQLGGLFLPAGNWEGGVLPARVSDYQAAILDQLIGSGFFRWFARGGGAGEVEVAFSQAGEAPWWGGNGGSDREGKPGSPGDPGTPVGAVGEAILSALESRGALFLPELWQMTSLSPQQTLDGLEELVLHGMVTNDTFGPIRHLLRRQAHGMRQRRPLALGALAAMAGMGRWSSLRHSAARRQPLPENLAEMLLARYGIVSREVAAADRIPWRAVSPVYAEWEIAGRVRRGYFVRGLSGVQYGRSAAVEGLRVGPTAGLPEMLGLTARDPALAWGRLLPSRDAAAPRGQNAVVVLRRGVPVLAGEGRPLRVTPIVPLETGALEAALRELFKPLKWTTPSGRKIEVEEYGGVPVLNSAVAETLATLGFERGYKTMIRWA